MCSSSRSLLASQQFLGSKDCSFKALSISVSFLSFPAMTDCDLCPMGGLSGHKRPPLEIVCGNWGKKSCCPSVLAAVGFADLSHSSHMCGYFLDPILIGLLFISLLLTERISIFSSYLVKIVFLFTWLIVLLSEPVPFFL